MKKTGTTGKRTSKTKAAAKVRGARKAASKRDDHPLTQEMIVGGTILAAQAGGKVVERAATDAYGWIKDKVEGWRKGKKKKKSAKRSPKKKPVKKR